MPHDTGCIDELIGPRMRAKGITCPCAKCQEQVSRVPDLRGPMDPIGVQKSDRCQVSGEKNQVPSTQHPAPGRDTPFGTLPTPAPDTRHLTPDRKMAAAHDVNGNDE